MARVLRATEQALLAQIFPLKCYHVVAQTPTHKLHLRVMAATSQEAFSIVYPVDKNCIVTGDIKIPKHVDNEWLYQFANNMIMP